MNATWMLLICMFANGQEVCEIHQKYDDEDFCEAAVVEYNEALKQVPTLLEEDPGTYFICEFGVSQMRDEEITDNLTSVQRDMLKDVTQMDGEEAIKHLTLEQQHTVMVNYQKMENEKPMNIIIDTFKEKYREGLLYVLEPLGNWYKSL